jgi:hypothetical protein
MTNAAVQEKPETQTTSEAEQDVASEDREVTANAPEVQPNSEQESTDTGAEETSRPDPRESRLQALADAEREEAEQRGEERALARLQGNTAEQQREAERQKVRQSHVNTLAKIDQIVAAAVDDYGAPRALTQYEAGQVKAAQNEYHKVALDAGLELAADTVRETAYGMLPTKEAQAQFTELTKGEVDLPTYLNHWAETAALHTKAVKSMGLEDAVKASTKIKREVEKAKLESYDEGREQGRLDPAGTSPDGGRTGQRSAPGMKTFVELETKYGDGTASKAEVAEYERLRDQRAKTR